MEPFEAILPPDLSRLRGLRHELADWLEAVGVASDDRDSAVLAIHEAAANGIEHATGRVTVRGARSGDKLLLVVSNDGQWRGRHARDEERGRGIGLMRALTSQLEIRTGPEGTAIRMNLDLRAETV